MIIHFHIGKKKTKYLLFFIKREHLKCKTTEPYYLQVYNISLSPELKMIMKNKKLFY